MPPPSKSATLSPNQAPSAGDRGSLKEQTQSPATQTVACLSHSTHSPAHPIRPRNQAQERGSCRRSHRTTCDESRTATDRDQASYSASASACRAMLVRDMSKRAEPDTIPGCPSPCAGLPSLVVSDSSLARTDPSPTAPAPVPVPVLVDADWVLLTFDTSRFNALKER